MGMVGAGLGCQAPVDHGDEAGGARVVAALERRGERGPILFAGEAREVGRGVDFAGRGLACNRLRGVTRLDSAGIGMLVCKYLTALRRGGALKLLHPTLRAEELLHMTRLTTVFEIFKSEDEAIRSFGTA